MDLITAQNVQTILMWSWVALVCIPIVAGSAYIIKESLSHRDALPDSKGDVPKPGRSVDAEVIETSATGSNVRVFEPGKPSPFYGYWYPGPVSDLHNPLGLGDD